MIFAYICKVGLFGSLCAGMFLTSCMERENEEASKRVIEVGKAISSPAELKASDYFDEIRYVPLETRDDCLVGSSPDIKLLDKYILITSANRQLNPAKRNVMVVKNEMRLLKQKRNVLQI